MFFQSIWHKMVIKYEMAYPTINNNFFAFACAPPEKYPDINIKTGIWNE